MFAQELLVGKCTSLCASFESSYRT